MNDYTNFEWVRACKQENALEGVLSFYKENYLERGSEEGNFTAIANILARVVDNIAPISMSKFLLNMGTPHYSEYSFNKKLVLVFLYHLRWVETTKIGGYKEWSANG